MLGRLRTMFRQQGLGIGLASIALFVAMGGTSVAADAVSSAAKLITGKQIKNNSVASGDLKNNSITATDIKDNSLLAQDFAPGQLPQGQKGDRGDRGPEGPPNPNAQDSDRLDGRDASDFLGATAKAADAELLDGVDSTRIVRGNEGRVRTAWTYADAGSDTGRVVTDWWEVWYTCPNPTSTTGTVHFRNVSGGTAYLLVDNGSANPVRQLLSNGQTHSEPASPTVDAIEFDMASQAGPVANVRVLSWHHPTLCQFELTGIGARSGP